ncbi:hypothetical protein AVEN_83598-1 [Araneus ventricosus]|uniref:Uncharacterized protein n=1 Tax=Araneus ventricosus TaxID=182803 RepID=A0A4Y2WQD0_ARAVE|nr:hypothetical protein AVEN_83598-1 [Araneus ventricosus]
MGWYLIIETALRGSPSLGEYGCPNPEVPRDLYSLPVYPPLSLLLFADPFHPSTASEGALHEKLLPLCLLLASHGQLKTPRVGRTSYATAVKKNIKSNSTQIVSVVLPSNSVSFKASYTPSEICPRSIDPVLKPSSTDTRNETVSFQFKVPGSNKNPPDLSDFKTVTNRKKLKDSQVNQDNITVDKVSQYYKPPQLPDKKPSEASISVISESNITVTKNGTKSAHVCFVGPVPDSMAAFPPEKAKVLQSLESDADAEMSSSSASEGDTLEYDMSEDLEDTPENVCPTTPPPSSTARNR